MQKLLDWRKENFVSKQTDHNNHNHDPNDLLHRAQFAAIMEKLAKTKTSEDCHEDLRGHQRAPGESPPLLHSTDDEGKRRRQDDFEPDVESLGPHGQSSAAINRRYIANASFGSNHHRPQRSHHNHKQHG